MYGPFNLGILVVFSSVNVEHNCWLRISANCVCCLNAVDYHAKRERHHTYPGAMILYSARKALNFEFPEILKVCR